jgi:hypothetical protein
MSDVLVFPEDLDCMKPGCHEAAAFAFRRLYGEKWADLFSCWSHTDLFHDLTLSVKYADAKEARFLKIEDYKT